MVVFDYARWKEQDAELTEIRRVFQASLPGVSVAVRGCWGPFEDTDGLASHFDCGAGRLAGTKKIKRIRVDLLTSCAKVLREASGFRPQFLVGLGQGGLVTAVLRWPLVVELTLQARNLQRKEARAVGEAWAGIKAIWAVRPRLWRTQQGHLEVAEACPELKKDFPEPPLRGFGIVGKQALGAEVLRSLRLDAVRSIDDASIRGMLDEPSRPLWDHEGLCICGKRTYLFSRCPACIEKEAVDTSVEIAEREEPEPPLEGDLEAHEVGLEVNSVLATLDRTGGLVRVRSSTIQQWAVGFRTTPKDAPVPTAYGMLSGKIWKKSHSMKLSLGSQHKDLSKWGDVKPYWTTWVVREDGAVVAGHNCSPLNVVQGDIVVHWSSVVNWHGHRHVVNEQCEVLWRSNGKEVALDPSFGKLIALVGRVTQVVGWRATGEASDPRSSTRQASRVLAQFFSSNEGVEGHWTAGAISRGKNANECKLKGRVLAFLGEEHKGPAVVLELVSHSPILCIWDHSSTKVKVEFKGGVPSLGLIAEEDENRRERLAVEARDAANISEFRVTGSLRTAWYEGQRRDPSLAGSIRKPEPPMVISGDGLLEREVTLRTGQTVVVPVVPNGAAGANGVTWRRACYNSVHCGVLGAHRSAEVTIKLLERAVWWPDLEKDVRTWVAKCLACIKGRSRPTKVEARAVKCGAETCWQEVSVDCEGPNREDREGHRYSLTYFDCLSHAVLLEPMRSLTHAEVRRAFVRCVLRSRTIPSLIRSDRGPEFKNALMAELSAMLGTEWRFSAPLRPCELGANERVHQEVQKVLGAVVRQVGASLSEAWSDWLVVAEYVIDNTPGPHGYTPRDLERSWSLALPLEKDVLRDALQFEPISDWARSQFKQFSELAAAVREHWTRSSEARAKLANRHRRTVDLKPGDRVVWNAPRARSEGAGRVPWKPGLTGPWRVLEVKGHRLTLEPVSMESGGTSSARRGPMEAHAEDCILVPADADGAESREPVVFEDDGTGGDGSSRPSLGQQVQGDAKQVEFTLTRRGRDFVLRLGDRIAYRGVGGGPKVCRLGRVTQVDAARAQVGVHRYLPDASGVRVKWRLAYIAEDGALTLSEGTRPAHEAVSVREIISKIDLNRDGVLAAASARKLDKGAYSLQDRTLERASRTSTGVLSTREALADLLVAEPRVLQPRASPESGAVESWFRQYFLGGVADVLEVAWGDAVVSDAARRHGYRVVPAFVQGKQAYGITWNLAAEEHLEAISGAVLRTEPKVLVIGLEGKNVPRAFLQLVVRCAQERTRAGAHVALHLQAQKGEWEPWRLEEWGALFGTLAEPRWPWAFVRADMCQFARARGRGNLVESGALWLADFSLESVGLRCSRPDALGAVQHKHVVRAQADYNLIGAAFCASLQDLGLRGAEELCTAAVESFPATAGADSAAAAPQPSPVVPLPDVRSGEDLTPAERAELDKEVDKYAAEKEAFWRTKADAKDWDSVRADLEVYALAGEKVAEDPRRTEAYRDLVWSGLKIEPGPTRPGLTDADIAAVREVIRRKAAGFWVEDTTRTTVRKFAHDCIPTGPPVSSQPHSLRGESAQWVDDKLEEECKRGQLIRGSSAWGSAPFPTKEMPSYKRHRKRRLVVDYRRVNARIKRSTYYCRRGSDVLAAAVGSVWYTFVDAVSGFNQIRNTKRAREVLAIVARSGKYLPVGLTFGPINGPDDFNFVVDRAYAPGRGRRLKYTKEWIAYVDDLTVRTGRVIDGQFFTDAQAEGAVREACAKGAVAAPQSASSALEALGVRGAHNSKRANHDAARSDQNHPTRVLMLRMLGLFGCFCVQGGCVWGGPFPRSPVCGQKDFSSFVACSFVRLSRSQCFASRPRGSVQGRSRSRRSLKAQTLRKLPKPPPQRFKCVVELG